jgi:serine/threonine protein kinase
MGEVYLAFDEKLGRNVALKILPAEFGSQDERVKRFALEARAISTLNHPGIVTIYDVGAFEGINYIATEFVEGKTLRELIGGKFKLRNILANSIQICDALSAAHREGIVHRDIKPENVMIREDGYAKILDFGLAKLTEVGSDPARQLAATKKGVIMGTPAYMSPAQISDEKIDHRTDLWSCGVVLYEFLTGINPFKGKDRQATFQAILSSVPPPPSSINPEITDDLDRILAKLLEKDPAMGYQTAADLRADLKRVKREIDSSPSWSSNTRSGRHSRSSFAGKWLLAAAAIAAAVVVLGIFSLIYYLRTEPASVDWASARSVQLTFQSGSETYPSLSPDGRSFVFSADMGRGEDIFLMRIGGGNTVNLTEDSPAGDTMPAFSPNGELIAFRSERAPAGIYVMGATGENPRRVADFGYTPSWAPDSKRLVIAERFQSVPSVRSISALWTIDIESGEKRKLNEGYCLQPAWSPDGERIAFWYTGNSGQRIVATVAATGGEPKPFAETGNTNWNPVWSPDGRFLYFASDRSGNMAFWRAMIDPATGRPGSEAELVPTPARYARHLSFSGDGRRFAYVQTTNRSNIRSAEFDMEHERIVGEPVWVTRGDLEIAAPELSPDGSRYFARIVRETQEDIVSISADGMTIRDLTNDAAFDRYARLSPDGTRLLFSSDRSGSYQLWMIGVDGSDLRQLTFEENAVASIPAWAPDGRRFSFDNESTAFIASLDKPFDKANLQQLPPTDNGGFFRVWDWSPDGTKLAGNFSAAAGAGVGFYSFETGRYEKLTDYFSIPRWLPDGRRLIFEHNGRAMIADTVTKEVRTILHDLPDEIRNISVSPDGRLLIYTTRERESDIWLLEQVD